MLAAWLVPSPVELHLQFSFTIANVLRFIEPGFKSGFTSVRGAKTIYNPAEGIILHQDSIQSQHKCLAQTPIR